MYLLNVKTCPTYGRKQMAKCFNEREKIYIWSTPLPALLEQLLEVEPLHSLLSSHPDCPSLNIRVAPVTQPRSFHRIASRKTRYQNLPGSGRLKSLQFKIFFFDDCTTRDEQQATTRGLLDGIFGLVLPAFERQHGKTRISSINQLNVKNSIQGPYTETIDLI
jgi:hypothetical protein